MFDVNQNSLIGSPNHFTDEFRDDLLIQACAAFWNLEKAKLHFVRGAGVMHLNTNSSKEFSALQSKITHSLEQIRSFSITTKANYTEKLRVLKYLSAATEFQDPDLFREIIALLDEWEASGFS